MTDPLQLVERLRQWSNDPGDYLTLGDEPPIPLMQEAADLIQALTDEIRRKDEALLSARECLMQVNIDSGYCCCGDKITAHTMGSGHSPVDADQYAAQQTIDQIDAALTSQSGRVG